MTFPLPQPFFSLLLGIVFYYFLLAGSQTFERNSGDEVAGGVAQFSFVATGSGASLLLGFRTPIPLWNGVASVLVLLCSLALYEWARHTIRERRFHLAWTGDVSDTLCEEGPYAFIRHPLYLSYMLAFLAMLLALPKLATLAIFLFNIALYTHAAVSDERSLAGSALAGDYARYKKRTGMFFPRLIRRRRPADEDQARPSN